MKINWSEEKVKKAIEQEPEIVPKHQQIFPEIELPWHEIWWLLKMTAIIVLILAITRLLRELRKWCKEMTGGRKRKKGKKVKK